MSQFYARYIPPSTVKPSPSEPGSINSKPSKTPHRPKKRKLEHSDDGESILAKYSSTQAAQRTKGGTQRALNRNNHSLSEDVAAETAQHEDTLSKTTAEELGEGENPLSKHSKLLSRFEKSKQRTSQTATSDRHRAPQAPHEHVHAERQNQIRDLVPIPQPETTTPETRAPTYATVPEWLRNPIRADVTARQDFKELGLSKAIQMNLASQSKKTALPVQSAVLPLLVNKDVEERPDLCVAAATGSGKTLAYVLPIVHALQRRRVRRLRAVIVVPTRALVKQVVHTLEYCSKGLDLKLGTAEGSKSIAEERRQLVEETLVYDPEEYRQQQEAPIDWGAFDHVAAIEQVQQETSFAHIGYIKSYSSKIDVLVCTPGRLIEHLQCTTGFNLDHVQWFVADEADRLLNESYHEWLETVLPALKSNAALAQRDQLLRYVYLDVPERRVTKILLSATMTSDISQILSMELHNPKLVVVESKKKAGNLQDDAVDMNEDAEYQMPPGLVESAIAFKDTENKPLYLLELLRVHIFTKAIQKQSHLGKPKENDVSSMHDSKVEADDHSGSASNSSDDSDSSSSISSLTNPGSSAVSLSSLDSSGTSSDSPSEAAPRRNRQPSPSTRMKIKPSPEPRVLIFTKSTESAHRLSRLLTLLSPLLGPSIATFTRSSTNTASNKSSKSLTRSRAKILQSFTSGTTRILISTDLAARGLDIPALEHVINYDVPASALTYVHRVGRTARAGMSGHAWTLVEHRQGKWFWETIGGKSLKEGEKKVIGRDDRVIQKVYVTVDREAWGEKYEAALKKLGEEVRAS